jgi:NADH-dependent peroxiredoxin subunit F
MLGPDVSNQIAEHLGLLRHPVELVAALDDGPTSVAIAELLEDLASLSPLVSVEAGHHPRRPSFAVTRPGTDIGVRFAGSPTGDALSSLVLALLQVGGHPPRIDDPTAARIRALEIPVEIETWFATSCRSCGDTVQAFGVIGVLNPRISVTAINGASFQSEAAARGVAAVPTVFVNGEHLTQGRLSVERAVELLERLTG